MNFRLSNNFNVQLIKIIYQADDNYQLY